MVAGYAIGGGHVLHLVCDLTIAADNARFGQTGPRVGSFDAGYGATLPRAHRRPQEGARDLVPVPPVRRAGGARHGPRQHGRPARRARGRDGPVGREILEQRPTALRFLKAAFNADTDGLAGLQQLAGDATLLYYLTEEGKEGTNAFLEKRKPDFSQVPALPVTTGRKRGDVATGPRCGSGSLAARPRDAAGRDRPGARRHGRRRTEVVPFRPLRLPRRAARRAADPDRHQLRQRRLRLPTRRRHAERLGPGAGHARAAWSPPGQVLAATWLDVRLAALLGLYLVVAGRLADLLMRRCCRSWPASPTRAARGRYGYHGLGDLFVFVFFGARRGGRQRLLCRRGPDRADRCRPGAPDRAAGHAAILVVNNLRDIDTDRAAGKRTLAVRLGRAPRAAVAVFVGDASVAGVPDHDRGRRNRRGGCVLLISLAAAPLVPAPRADRSDAHGRPGPERRARGRRAPARASSPILLSVGLLLSDEDRAAGDHSLCAPFREPYVTARGAARAARDAAGAPVGGRRHDRLGEAVPLSLRGGPASQQIAGELAGVCRILAEGEPVGWNRRRR